MRPPEKIRGNLGERFSTMVDTAVKNPGDSHLPTVDLLRLGVCDEVYSMSEAILSISWQSTPPLVAARPRWVTGRLRCSLWSNWMKPETFTRSASDGESQRYPTRLSG